MPFVVLYFSESSIYRKRILRRYAEKATSTTTTTYFNIFFNQMQPPSDPPCGIRTLPAGHFARHFRVGTAIQRPHQVQTQLVCSAGRVGTSPEQVPTKEPTRNPHLTLSSHPSILSIQCHKSHSYMVVPEYLGCPPQSHPPHKGTSATTVRQSLRAISLLLA